MKLGVVIGDWWRLVIFNFLCSIISTTKCLKLVRCDGDAISHDTLRVPNPSSLAESDRLHMRISDIIERNVRPLPVINIYSHLRTVRRIIKFHTGYSKLRLYTFLQSLITRQLMLELMRWNNGISYDLSCVYITNGVHISGTELEWLYPG
jgi:hypothetical protein